MALEDRAGDFSTLDDEAVARVAKLMRIDVTPEMLRATGGVVNAGAYESYLKALGYTQRYDKPGNLDLAITALDNAVRADPRFALGFAQLGEAYRLKYQLDKNTKWIDEALANCQKAQQLDDRLPAVYVTLGHIHRNTGKYDLALQEYQARCNSTSAMPMRSSGWLYITLLGLNLESGNVLCACNGSDGERQENDK
jgi:tetratricopeptide (TPR) repeat protein